MTVPSGALILVPFDKRECINLAQAAGIAGKAPGTIKNWCETYGLGRLIGGTWSVSRVALSMFLDGDRQALRAYHAGDRSTELVTGYFQRCGLPYLLGHDKCRKAEQ